jgi:hypothetical protein
MTRCEDEPGCAIEVHGFSFEEQGVVLRRLRRGFVASGCWTVGYRRRARGVEFSLNVGLDAAMEMYCGLVAAGLELTGVSHRVLTELCVLGVNERMSGGRSRRCSRRVNVRIVTSFIRVEKEMELWQVIAASA